MLFPLLTDWKAIIRNNVYIISCCDSNVYECDEFDNNCTMKWVGAEKISAAEKGVSLRPHGECNREKGKRDSETKETWK